MAKKEHMCSSRTAPDSKVTLGILCFLCQRLLTLNSHIKAARLIQVWWRMLKAIQMKTARQIKLKVGYVSLPYEQLKWDERHLLRMLKKIKLILFLLTCAPVKI